MMLSYWIWLVFMNVSVSHVLYIHTLHESYINVEWIKITRNNLMFKENCTTHVIPVKKLVDFSVTQ